MTILIPIVAVVLAITESTGERTLQILNQKSQPIDTVYVRTDCGYIGDTINVNYIRLDNKRVVVPDCAESQRVGAWRTSGF